MESVENAAEIVKAFPYSGGGGHNSTGLCIVPPAPSCPLLSYIVVLGLPLTVTPVTVTHYSYSARY